MTIQTTAKLLGFVAVAGLTVFLWLHAPGRSISEPPSPDTKELGGSVAIPRSDQPVGAATDSKRDASPSPPPSDDERTAAVTVKMAERLYASAGPSFIEYLASKGLSRSDGERVVADGIRDMAKCQLDAALAQAEVQSVPADVVLASLDESGVPLALDPKAVVERVEPCMSTVRQRMGLPTEEFAAERSGVRPRSSR